MKPLNVIPTLILCAGLSASAQWKSFNGPEGSPVIASILEDGASETVIEFNVAGYNQKSINIESNPYSVLSVPEAPIFLEKGYPELPRVNRSIVIPDEAKMRVEIVEAEYDTVDGVLIAPSKGSLPRSIDPHTVPYTFSDFYKTDTFWPVNTIELSQPFIIRDLRGITLRFNLFRYNAVREQLVVCKRLVVRVFAEGIDDVNVKKSRRTNLYPDFYNLYQRFFLNFSEDKVRSLGKAAYADIGETGRMLIIAADSFYTSAIPLRDWRTRKGHKTRLVKCSDVGTTWDDIQDYIQDMYDTDSSVTYILLVGEGINDDIPSTSVPYPGSESAPTDPTYTLLAGDDPYPDAYVARISAENVDQVDNQVRRIIKYETNPVSGSWFHKACGIASHQGNPADSTRCNWLRDDLLASGYSSVDKLYDITSASPITNALNTGRGVVNFIGHGIETEWGFNQPCVWPLFSVDDVQTLSNTNLLPFIFSVACEVGSFSEISTCFSEAWLRSGTKDSPKGAIGFYGSSIIQPWVEPCVAQAEAMDLLVADDKITVGGLCFNGSCKMIEDYPWTGPNVFYTWNIFGDAATHVWTDTPSEFTNVQIMDDGEFVYINANTDGCDICACSGNNGSGYHSVAYDVSGTGFETQVRPLYITVTKHNYIPYTAVTGGTFTSAETWFGNMNVLSGCSFTSNASLTLLPGTKVLMDGYFNLSFVDNARLIAEGTEDAPIIFTSSNGTSPKSWRYLYIRTSNNVLSHCEVKYGNYGIFMIGYPSTGNVVEHCNIHDNDQGIRMQSNDVDITNCDIYDNRHNVVTMYNAEVDIEGTHIHDGGRDGIYCYSADLLNIYGSVIEDNGNGGTSTRNGIYAGYADLINLGSPYSPVWQGLSTVRNNYSTEIYSAYGTDCIYMYYSSIHDDSGYELYNYYNYAEILGVYCWWGESPPNYSQFYGDVVIPIWMESEPAWEGQTSSGGLSKAVNFLTLNNESPEERIARLKNTVTSDCRSKNADTALTELFGLIRSDYVDNQYRERQNFYSLLSQVYNEAKNYPAGQRALQYMIVWKILENDKKSAIDLSQQGLTILDEPDRMGVFGNLVYLYASNAHFDKAGEYLEEFQKQYAFNTSEIEFLTESIKVMEEMYEEEKRLAKDSTPPDDEDITTVMPDKFALEPAYPNPFNASTVFNYQLPKESHVEIRIYNLNGQLVQTLVNDRQMAGYYSANWNSAGLASGIYLYQIVAGDFQKVRKCMLIK